MGQVSSAGFAVMRRSPLFEAYAAVAPDVEAFPRPMDKTGELLRRPSDWTGEVRALTSPALLVFADADGIPLTHAAEFFALLGGGLHDAGWDGAQRPASQLAVLPHRTHHDVLEAPERPGLVTGLLDRA